MANRHRAGRYRRTPASLAQGTLGKLLHPPLLRDFEDNFQPREIERATFVGTGDVHRSVSDARQAPHRNAHGRAGDLGHARGCSLATRVHQAHADQ